MYNITPLIKKKIQVIKQQYATSEPAARLQNQRHLVDDFISLNRVEKIS